MFCFILFCRFVENPRLDVFLRGFLNADGGLAYWGGGGGSSGRVEQAVKGAFPEDGRTDVRFSRVHVAAAAWDLAA